MKINYWQPFEKGAFYHIYNHAIGTKNLFIKNVDYISFLSKYNKYCSHIFQTYAFCLMPNHFHFIIKAQDPISVPIDSNSAISYSNRLIPLDTYIRDQFRRLFSSHTLSYNHRNKTSGQLFLKRTKSVSFSEEKLEYLMHYVHQNPIHHGFTKDILKWKYTSYSSYLGLDNYDFISQNEYHSLTKDEFMEFNKNYSFEPLLEEGIEN